MRKTSSRIFVREPQRQRRPVSLAKIPNRLQEQQQNSLHPILALQRSLGNQAVLRMLQRGLLVGPTADASEQQADRVARAVMHMPNAAAHRAINDERIQLRPASSGSLNATTAAAPQSVHEVLRSPGRPLDSSVRRFMERRFKHDFGHVRVHDDARAADSARGVSALAYTVGRHVVFGAGRYSPETNAGKTLIAHELAHVLQHNAKQPVIRRAVEFSDPGNPHRDDPIPRILASRQIDLGLTTPTVNARQLPATDRDAAARMVLDAITPPDMHRSPPPPGSGSGVGSGSGSASPAIEYQFTEFTMRVSANMNLPTAPSNGKWGSEYIDTHTFKAPPECQKKDQVPVTMEGDPSSDALATLIKQNEQEHVDDIKSAVNAQLAPAYNWLMGLRGRGATDKQAQDDLFRQAAAGIGGRVGNFLDAVRTAVAGRDARGGHSVCGETRVIGTCDRLAIKVKKGLCSH